MALQLPEPDYYTIEEVAQRWGISLAVLLRLGHEGKLAIGANWTNSVLTLGIVEERFDAEYVGEILVPHSVAKSAGCNNLMSDGRVLCTGRLVIDPRHIPYSKETTACTTISPWRYLPWPPDKLPNDWFYVPWNDYRLQSVFDPDGTIKNWETMTSKRASPRFMVGDLIIPTSEIHRIENRHDEAQKAAAEDVLGTRKRESAQAIIAAMAQVMASKAPGYRRGDKPNASQIADAICKTGLVDLEAATIAKEISAALKNFGR